MLIYFLVDGNAIIFLRFHIKLKENSVDPDQIL